MDKKRLEEKLRMLLEKLKKMETVEAEKIRRSRIAAGMGDDYRENEAAKVVMEDHQLLHMRVANLKREIVGLKKEIYALKRKD